MRVVVLAPPVLPEFDRRTLDLAFASGLVQIVGACIDSRPPKSLALRLKEEFRRGRGGYVLVMIAHKLLGRFSVDQGIDSSRYFTAHQVPTHATVKLSVPATLDFIRSREPDCLYRCGFGIIREPVLSLVAGGVLSYHHGNMREYRGQPVAFWELFNGESRMGVTVQVLGAGLDCGKIAAEQSVPIRRSDTWSSLHRRAYETSAGLFVEACRALSTAGFAPLQLAEDQLGRLYTLPNLRQYLALQAKVLVRKIAECIRPHPAGEPGR